MVIFLLSPFIFPVICVIPKLLLTKFYLDITRCTLYVGSLDQILNHHTKITGVSNEIWSYESTHKTGPSGN